MKRKRKKSIKDTVLYSFLTLIIGTLMIFLFISIKYAHDNILANSINYSEQNGELINREIDSYISYMDNISRMVAEGEDAPQYIYAVKRGSKDDAVIKENSKYSPAYDLDLQTLNTRIEDQFNVMMNARTDIANMGIIVDESNFIINDGSGKLNPAISLEDVGWLRDRYKKVDGVSLSTSHVQNLVAGDYRWVITLSRFIRNKYTNERQGLFFIDLNYDIISDLCANSKPGTRGYVFIIDENGEIIYHPKQQLLYSGLLEENVGDILASKERFFVTEEQESRLYTMCKSEKTGWTVVGVAYVDELMKDSRRTQFVYYMTAGILIALAIAFSNIIAIRITKPITMLKESMREVEKGNFKNANVPIIEENEIGSLSRNFNLMTDKIDTLMEQNIAVQKEKRKSELKALQAQINPHFLYNTLDSIIWMAENEEHENVVKMTASLAYMMRRNFNNQEEEIEIKKELEYVESYLTIQKMRYMDQLNFEISVESSLYKFHIIKLILQPLVENAIYHGIKYKEGGGIVRICGFLQEDTIIMEICDNGAGMDEERLAHIFDEHKVNYRSNGVGVYNVQRRLQLYYGQEYGLQYESAKGVGTKVRVCIPMGGKRV